MHICTLSLNPAIDQTIRVDHFSPNTVNRGDSLSLQAGGKGVNVAAFLRDYTKISASVSLSVTASGFLGEENARIFEQLFHDRGIQDRFIRLPGSTRTGIKIIDEARQQTTDINLPGIAPDEAALNRLNSVLQEIASDADWFVLTGSLPPGVPADYYARLIHLLRAHSNGQVILDTSGPALRASIQACPVAIKPNISELEGLTGARLESVADIRAAAEELLQRGIGLVIVSLGERGALFARPGESLLAIPPAVHVRSTVGAGDAMVAGLLCAHASATGQPVNLSTAARLATAFSLAAITDPARTLPDLLALNELAVQVTIEPL